MSTCRTIHRAGALALTAVLMLFVGYTTVRTATACTCITLRAENGAVVVGRTMEWAAFDIESEVVVVPRGCRFESNLGDGRKGVSWESRYGAVGFDYLELDQFIDGMNEKGLVVNALYHPGFADYPPMEDGRTDQIEVQDVTLYLLNTCETVEEARAAVEKVRVVGRRMPQIGGIPAPLHLLVTEPSGKQLVIEFCDQAVQFYDAPLGVMTNSPRYDWHMTNLRNFANLSQAEPEGREVRGVDIAPFGRGAGGLGMPGDMTPTSRFVRASVFSSTARDLADGTEANYEIFRILDNFNVSRTAQVGGKPMPGRAIRSGTQWTASYDTRDLVIEYHTMDNRRVRRIDLRKIDFGSGECFRRQPMDKAPTQDIEDVTPA